LAVTSPEVPDVPVTEALPPAPEVAVDDGDESAPPESPL
jgi:hypothetical protein